MRNNLNRPTRMLFMTCGLLAPAPLLAQLAITQGPAQAMLYSDTVRPMRPSMVARYGTSTDSTDVAPPHVAVRRLIDGVLMFVAVVIRAQPMKLVAAGMVYDVQ